MTADPREAIALFRYAVISVATNLHHHHDGSSLTLLNLYRAALPNDDRQSNPAANK